MRGKQAPKRKIAPDGHYNNVAIAKFVNYIMHGGKKNVAERVVYDALAIVEKKEKKDALDVFNTAIKNISPSVEVRGKRVGGANYQIPVSVRGSRQQSLAFRWIIDAARAKKGRSMSERLATEIIDAANEEGSAIKKKQDVQKMAEANKAFSHFAGSF